jgi:hypothetical protein
VSEKRVELSETKREWNLQLVERTLASKLLEERHRIRRVRSEITAPRDKAAALKQTMVNREGNAPAPSFESGPRNMS